MGRLGILCVLLMCAAPVAAQGTGPAIPESATDPTAPGTSAAATQNASGDALHPSSSSGIVGARLLVLAPAEASDSQTASQRIPIASEPAQPFQSQQGFQWVEAFKQYMTVLTWQHSVRLFQEKTHTELGGPVLVRLRRIGREPARVGGRRQHSRRTSSPTR